MSDLYMVLRSRLELMAQWVTLGADQMLEAQKAIGLSDERVARRIHVATRTWIRWRQRGQVPVHSLDRVAEVLGIEIERPRPVRVSVEAPDVDGDDVTLGQVVAEIRRLRAAQDEFRSDVDRRLDRLEARVAPAGRQRARRA